MNQYQNMSGQGVSQEVICDLRSDTVTKPDDVMRAAMANAVVGDDVYGEDPTINACQEKVAALLGKEASIFMASGTQSNLSAMMAHCQRGEEIIVGDCYHTFVYEAAGASVLAGVALYPVETGEDGSVAPEAVLSAIKEDDPHHPRSSLLCLENTVNGNAIPLEKLRATSDAAREAGLSVHLDGARLFNAATELQCDIAELADCADTVSVCMSKGLGAPVGSFMVGSKEHVRQAKRNRKILGGGMRQAGVLAAAAMHALEHNVAALKQDHERAETLATELRDMNAGEIAQNTNMVFLTPRDQNPDALRQHMSAEGIRIGGQSPTIRMVLNRDVTDTALSATVDAFKTYFRRVN